MPLSCSAATRAAAARCEAMSAAAADRYCSAMNSGTARPYGHALRGEITETLNLSLQPAVACGLLRSAEGGCR